MKYPDILIGQQDYVARGITYLSRISPDCHPVLFACKLDTEKPDRSVFDLDAIKAGLAQYSRNDVIWVFFSAKYQNRIRELLAAMGFSQLIFYDAALDNMLKKQYFLKQFAGQNKEFQVVYDLPVQHESMQETVEVYMAKCVVDKPIQGYPKKLSRYIIPIQVGAALTDERISTVNDAEGDNISERNRRYSEMTAFYWMWKNAKSDYLGICHYRRLWVDLDKIVEKLRTTDVDAILPLPTLAEHSVFDDYLLKHIPDVWRPMMDVLQQKSPDYYEAAQSIFKGNIFYASNMCILRRDVLNDLCEWMFPIVMEVEKRVGDLPDTYYNRYAGFCTERLITLYFLYNKQHWDIAHAEKVFLS